MSKCEPSTNKSPADNRSSFPASAAILDSFRAEFGDGVKLFYLMENGREVGKKAPEPKRFMTVEQWLKGSALHECAREISAAKKQKQARRK